MGDISAEPSMEEILSSIKRIIAEEGDGVRPPARKPARAPVQLPPAAQRAEDSDPERYGVLELSEPMPAPAPERAAASAPPPPAEPIVSHQAAAASRGSLEALTKLIVKPENPQGDNTLEGLVREMLRPMLRDWLDAHLPAVVEAMVSREIERITGAR